MENTTTQYISDAFDWSRDNMPGNIGIVLASIPPDRYKAMLYHLATQLVETTDKLDKYREFTANELCKGCSKEYYKQFDGIDCESGNEEDERYCTCNNPNCGGACMYPTED